jgi:alanine racemase
MKKHYERIYAAIDLDALGRNVEYMHQKLDPDTKIMGVVKTDGYGHGALPIARQLEPLDYMYGFATATAEEAVCLRKGGVKKPLLILGYVFPYSYEELIREDIRFTLFREDMLEQLEAEAAKQNKTAKVHLKVDTGMARIGIMPDEEGLAFVGKVLNMPHIELEGIYTHFAKADYADKEDAYRQYRCFSRFCDRVEEQYGIKIPLKHCANSAAILEMPDTRMDMVRAGIVMYGLWPSEEIKKEEHPLTPVFSLHSHIVYLKTLPAGTGISYGHTFVTHKETTVATICVGYGDGYPRALSGKGYVLIHGQKAPILGRVCMDQFMVDVTHIPQTRLGDEVTLIGSEGEETITMETLGELADRFNYELACDIGKRVPRIYLKEGRECYAKDYFDDYSIETI